MTPNSTPNSFFRSPSEARCLIAGALVLVGAVLAPATTQAQFGLIGGGIVFDPSNFARNVLHYARRLDQMNLQRQQLQQQLAAMQKLRNPHWRQIEVALAQMDALMQQGQALAYSARAIDAEFQRTFPGPQLFRDYPTEERTQSVRTLATLRGAINAAHRASREFSTSVARLDAMKRQLGTVRGHEEVLELNGTIGMYSAEELTMLRQAIAGLTNVQAVYYADQVNADAQRQATIRSRLQAMSAPGPRYASISLHAVP
jgi:P-type conjugative transfer protein TrbJ